MSDNYSLIIKNGSCYIDGKLAKVDVALSGNKIKKIGQIELNSSKVFDATDKVVLPGIIDTQTHFREPGSTDVEDLESGSRAAVLGGVTSLFEMPNTNPPTSNLIEFDKKLQLAKDRMHSNYAFYFGATPENIDQLSKLKDVEGCCGVKLFAGSQMGIHYDYKSTRNEKAMKKEAKRKARIEERRAKKSPDSQNDDTKKMHDLDKPITLEDLTNPDKE